MNRAFWLQTSVLQPQSKPVSIHRREVSPEAAGFDEITTYLKIISRPVRKPVRVYFPTVSLTDYGSVQSAAGGVVAPTGQFLYSETQTRCVLGLAKPVSVSVVSVFVVTLQTCELLLHFFPYSRWDVIVPPQKTSWLSRFNTQTDTQVSFPVCTMQTKILFSGTQ